MKAPLIPGRLRLVGGVLMRQHFALAGTFFAAVILPAATFGDEHPIGGSEGRDAPPRCCFRLAVVEGNGCQAARRRG